MLSKENLTRITYDNKGTLYAGSESGNIYKVAATNTVFPYMETGYITTIIKYDSINNTLLVNDKTHLISASLIGASSKTTIKTPKDIEIVSEKRLITADNNTISFINENAIKSIQKIGRCNDVFYDRFSQNTWISAINGLYVFDKNLNYKKFNEKILPTAIAGDSGSIWVATSNTGIYNIIGDSVVTHLTTETGLLSDKIRKVILKKNQLYIIHGKGLQVYNVEYNTYSNYNITDGLNSNYIIDIAVYNKEVSIITHKGLQKFNLSDIVKNNQKPFVSIDRVQVNSKEVKDDFNQFVYDQNQIEFSFKARSYQHRGTLKYQYRLIGLDSSWYELPFSENHIKFLALSHGDYSFNIKAVNENKVESDIQTYFFTINAPFWISWWFISSIVFLFLAIIYGIYRIQIARLKKINKRKQELTSSKLVALKSQMNPHFIFNALNSIQDLVLKEETDNSYHYIVKFADLVRRTLNYSDQDFIDFEEEVELP